MKQYILFLSFFATLFLGACSSKSDPTPVTPTPVTPTPVTPTVADLVKKCGRRIQFHGMALSNIPKEERLI